MLTRATLLALAAILGMSVVLVVSSPATIQQSPSAALDDLRKLHAAFEFVRGRNARDYAISTPNGIDEAKYFKVGGIEQWVIRGGHFAAFMNPSEFVKELTAVAGGGRK